MKQIIITQRYFTNDNNEIIGYITIDCCTTDFGVITLEIPKNEKKTINIIARKLGFRVGKLDVIPEDTYIVFQRG